jgi:hypothetical protein
MDLNRLTLLQAFDTTKFTLGRRVFDQTKFDPNYPTYK